MATGWELGNRGTFRNEGRDTNGTVLILCSFLGGVVSSSVMWWYFGRRLSLRTPGGKDDPRRLFFHSRSMTLDDLRDSLQELKSRLGELPTALDDLMNRLSGLPSSFDDIRNRIGELPGLTRRRRWPWDRSRPRRSDDDSLRSFDSFDSSEHDDCSVQNKSDFCIGSIFGLDVGGTLGKLVYFEQKLAASDVADDLLAHQRERSYRAAASAKTVLMARADGRVHNKLFSSASFSAPSTPERERSANKVHEPSHKHSAGGMMHSLQSKQDLANLHRLRQESVPDDLNAYAESVHLNKEGSPPREKEKHREDGEPSEATPMRKSRSMQNFTRHREQALDEFYNFARRLDSYREGLKDDKLSFYSRELQGEFHFIHFETRRMQQAMDLIRTNNLHLNIREMGATGGGAHKFAAKWEEELGISMKKQDELDSLVAGMQFVLSTVVGECYSFRPRKGSGSAATSSTAGSVSSFSVNDDDAMSNDGLSEAESGDIGCPSEHSSADAAVGDTGTNDVPLNRGSGDDWWWSRKVRRDAISYSSTYPYLVVTIGTGVSILRVDGPRKYERVSGSTIGGGTYWGLIRLLTDVEDFEDVLRLAARGDPTKIDMMVGDIYGENSDALEKLGLPANLVASSFGKLVAKEDPASGLNEEDLARALLLMITNNIGQVAYLNAKLAKTSRIYFVGNFLRQNKISQRRLAYAIDFWSKGEMEALFLEHEGYFGALGAFLMSQDINNNETNGKPGSMRRSQSVHVAPEVSSDSDEPTQPSSAATHRRSSTVAFM